MNRFSYPTRTLTAGRRGCQDPMLRLLDRVVHAFGRYGSRSWVAAAAGSGRREVAVRAPEGTKSIRDVAAEAGVSVGTVSNVLNRPELVAPATRARVEQAIAALGFVRNESARQLRAGRSRTLGLLVLDVSNPFFTDVARGVEDAAAAAGLAVILCNSDEKEERERSYLDLLEEHRVHGILITPVKGVSERLRQMQLRGTPVVLLDRWASTRNHCSVSVNDVYGGELAVTHLVERGHRRIAFVGGPFSIKQVHDRHDGARRALLAAGPPPPRCPCRRCASPATSSAARPPSCSSRRPPKVPGTVTVRSSSSRSWSCATPATTGSQPVETFNGSSRVMVSPMDQAVAELPLVARKGVLVPIDHRDRIESLSPLR